MGLSIDDALGLLAPILELQAEVDKVNQEEYERKFKIKEKCKDTLRWDENLSRLRHPCITSSQISLFQERSEIAKAIPHFWSTALAADQRLLRYMNRKEQEIMLKYLKSVEVFYDDGLKSGYTIYLSIDKNPYFHNCTLEKTVKFTRQGIHSEEGYAIEWKNNKDNEVFPKGGTQNKPSFFKWYATDSHSFRDLVAEEIVLEFWPNAHKYYLIGIARGSGVRQVEDALSKLTPIRAELQQAEQQAKWQATEEKRSKKIEQQLVLVKEERIVHKECESLRRQLYNRRSEIIKSIPCFWLTAFLSHYALHRFLSREDQKIFRFLNSVNVEETEDDEGVISGYTITFKFDDNPYFENDSLKKTISYTLVSTDPLREYCESEVEICGSDIHWKDGMDITGNERGFTGTGTSFFTWFSDLGYVAMKAYDEVANLIKQDLWPDAGRYFVYGNIDDEKKNWVDLNAIKKTARFTSSLRAFFI